MWCIPSSLYLVERVIGYMRVQSPPPQQKSSLFYWPGGGIGRRAGLQHNVAVWSVQLETIGMHTPSNSGEP